MVDEQHIPHLSCQYTFVRNQMQCVTKKKVECLQCCKIIIWDECTMTHKHSLEAFLRTLQDLKGNDKLFGGTVLLLF